MEPCSAAELMDVFSVYYEAGVKQISNNHLLKDKTTGVDVDFDHPAFCSSVGSTAPPVRAVSSCSAGEGNADCDIESLIMQD
jgi:hypothetical protein